MGSIFMAKKRMSDSAHVTGDNSVLSTSSRQGMEGIAPLRETAREDAMEASRRHSCGESPLATPEKK